MTNKPMLSVERELLSNLSYAIAANDMHACVSIGKELRALLDKPDTPYTPKGEWSFEYIDGGDIVIRNGEDWTLIKRGDGPIYEQFLYRFCEEQLKPADHPQCEECKGWGYHENHYEGGGTECGECGGSGNATVAEVMVMPDRMKVEPFTTIDRGSKNYKSGYNAAIAEVAKLNGLKT